MPRPGFRLRRAIAAALLLAVTGASSSAAGDVYTVAEVAVDVRADSAADAREQALAEAHRAAFDRLMRRIVPTGQLDALPEVSRDRIADMVGSFSVESSQTSNVRYLGELSFSFERSAVRGFLRRHQVPFAETRSPPVAVLALHGSRDDAVLWADPNPWRQAWVRRANDRGLVPFAVPLGDLGDIQAISAEAAVTHAPEPIRAIADRYDADTTLVSRANAAGDPETGTATLRIRSTLVPADGGAESFTVTLDQQAEEDGTALYDRAADRVARRVQDRWKRDNLLRFDERRATTVRVPLGDLQAWVRVRRRLSRVPVIASVMVRTMARTEAVVQVHHFGGREQLSSALSQHQLQLTPAGGSDGRPVLRPAGAVAEPAIGGDAAAEES